MSVRPDHAAWTAACLGFFAEPGLWDSLVAWARASRCLPIYADMTVAIGIDAAGRLLQYEDEPPNGRERESVVTDVRVINVALRQGAKRYAWLEPLFPERPANAPVCSCCKGSGLVEDEELRDIGVLCHCGGAGWVPSEKA